MFKINQWKFNFHGFQLEEAKQEVFLMLPVCFTRGLLNLEIVHGYSHGTVLMRYFQSAFLFDCKQKGWVILEVPDPNPGSSCFRIQSAPAQLKSLYLTYFNLIFNSFKNEPFSFIEMLKICQIKTSSQIKAVEYYLEKMIKYNEAIQIPNSEKNGSHLEYIAILINYGHNIE